MAPAEFFAMATARGLDAQAAVDLYVQMEALSVMVAEGRLAWCVALKEHCKAILRAEDETESRRRARVAS